MLTEATNGSDTVVRETSGNRSLVLFDRGDDVTVQAGEEGIRFLLVSGRPIQEPVAWYGPIVMNTQDELRRAVQELREGLHSPLTPEFRPSPPNDAQQTPGGRRGDGRPASWDHLTAAPGRRLPFYWKVVPMMSLRSTSTLALGAACLLAACSPDDPTDALAPDAQAAIQASVGRPPTVEVFATGLQFPRGLAFGPRGELYVAEAGSAGTTSTTQARCAQVGAPIGPTGTVPPAGCRASTATATGPRWRMASRPASMDSGM